MRGRPGSPTLTSTDLTVSEHQGSVPLSVVLFRLANDNSRERISVGDLAIGALMFFFAAPNILPVPPGVSTLLGAPLLFLSAQLMLGMRPWLPGVITRCSISRDDLATLVRRIVPWLAKAEKLLKPRALVLVRPPVEYFVGLICLVLAAILMLAAGDRGHGRPHHRQGAGHAHRGRSRGRH